MGIIEEANALPIEGLRAECLHPFPNSCTFNDPRNGVSYTVTLESYSSLSPADLKACFSLIQETSADMYRNSSTGWSPAKKRKEMALPDMRYLIVKRRQSNTSQSDGDKAIGSIQESCSTTPDRRKDQSAEPSNVGAFLSFMLTYEDGHEVVYCYELHVSIALRCCGLGKKLIGMMEDIGRRIGVEKAMLTVFLENDGAVKFYHRSG